MRRLAAGLLPAAAVVVAWTALEDPRRPLWLALAGAVGLLAGHLAVDRARGVPAVAGGALVVACGAAGTLSPRAVLATVLRGARDAPVVHAPLDPATERPLHVLLVVAVFGLAALVGHGVAAGRPLRAGVVAAVGVAWPATLLDRHAVPWACLAVAAALLPSFVLRASGLAAAFAGGVGLLLATGSAAVAGAGGLGATTAHVDWRGWDPLGRAVGQVSVRYVWDADYSGIRFPRRPTVVLRIEAPRRALYWRASTLDSFTGDRWIESLYPRAVGAPDGSLPSDPLLPPTAARPSSLVRQAVTVVALDDARLVAASTPVRLRSSSLRRVLFLSGGVLGAPGGVPSGSEYTVWSATPRPAPRALARSPAQYPAALGRYLDLGRTRMPGFGEPGRAARVAAVFTDVERYPELAPYDGVRRLARRLTRGTGSPYLATLALERWLRAGGGYVYDEVPPAPPAGVPPLADFALGTRRGYCQHYAGTMALMLRTIGVPARVAVGFTSGRYADGTWTVTDWDAHAWVEAWFAGYGWLPFDPTPGRGRFSALYSFASDSADAVRALGTGRLLDFSPQPPGEAETTEPGTVPSAPGRSAPLWPLAPIGAGGLVAVAIAGAKRRVRHRRLTDPDPRARALGIRLELVGRLRDHGLRLPAETPLGEAARAAERRLGVSTRRLVDLALAARFAPPAAAHVAAAEATGELHAVEVAIRRRRGRARSLLAAIRPRLGR